MIFLLIYSCILFTPDFVHAASLVSVQGILESVDRFSTYYFFWEAVPVVYDSK